jgi:hypothetical protein
MDRRAQIDHQRRPSHLKKIERSGAGRMPEKSARRSAELQHLHPFIDHDGVGGIARQNEPIDLLLQV